MLYEFVRSCYVGIENATLYKCQETVNFTPFVKIYPVLFTNNAVSVCFLVKLLKIVAL